MKSPYVSELVPNQVTTATLLVQHKDIRQKKSGEPYLSLTLGDRTGEIDAKMWDNAAEVLGEFERDDFLKVRGLVQVFQNRLQFTIHKLQKQGFDAVDFTDFYPASERNPEEMFAELGEVIASVGNEHLRALLTSITADGEIVKRLKIAPAAKTIHHSFLGGLLEHVLSLCRLAKLTASHYKDIDLDLLLTGAILHDIGKIHELTYDRSFGYSTDGQLLGHIIIGVQMVGEKIRALPDFPPKLQRLVEHMIVSHHGELAFGSPKLPAFPEALLLHHLDNLDSKMECMRAFAVKDKQVEGCWTGYCGTLERSVLKKGKYLAADEPSIAQEPEQAQQPVARFTPPAPPPRPAPQTSLFADKLKSALKP